LTDNTINGYILRNFEEYAFVKNECEYVKQKKEVITDYNLYIMNQEAAKFWSELEIKQYTAPVELNYAELKELKGLYYDMIVYGRIPLMVSAQCIAKTASGGTNKYINRDNDNPCCEAEIKNIELIDRYQKSFQVKRHCRDCYNTIYNSQCLSLLNNKEEILKVAPANIRLNFTFESPEETEKIISAFINHYIYDLPQDEIVKDYTRGQFKRGIE
jgi:putative protease